MSTPRYRGLLQPASFRGIKFFIKDVEVTFGRRNSVHEYPFRDDPYAEDLGRLARTYTFNAYVIGDNVFEDQKRLIDAIENDATPGILIHPTLGLMNVKPQECRAIHNNSEGGIEYFTLTFVQSGKNVMPVNTIDTQSNSISKTAASAVTLKSSFATKYMTSGFSDSLATKSSDILIGKSTLVGGSVIFQNDSLYGNLLSNISKVSYPTALAPTFSAYKNSLEDFKSNVPDLVTEPEDLATAVINLVNGLSDLYPDNPDKLIVIFIQLYNNFGSGFPDVTPINDPPALNELQLYINQSQILDLVQIACLLQMVVAVANKEFESRDEAILLMNKIDTLIQQKLLYLGNLGDDTAYNALNTSRVAMILDIKTRSATLRTVKTIRNNYPIPALVFAYQQYQDANQADDIISRNKVINPLFIPSNRDLEILV